MLYLGVDSGGTKTAFVISDETGKIIARHTAEGGSTIRRSRDELSEPIEAGVLAACEKAGITRPDIACAVFGFPGFGETADSADILHGICRQAMASDRVRCYSDAVVAWAGSLALHAGVNMIAGTGSVCHGQDETGRQTRTGGWGAYCDEGSGSWIGMQLIHAFSKQADGRMERTALYHVVRAHFRLEDDWLFCEPLNRRINTRSKELASLTPLVMEAYDLGDPVALDICERAAQELWQHIETTARKMGFADGAYRASYSGGVFKAEERILAPLRALAKGHADLRPPRFAPELGAVLLAMRADGIQRDFDGFSFTEQA